MLCIQTLIVLLLPPKSDNTTSARLGLITNRTYDYTRNYIYAASAFVAISSFILAIAAAGLSPLGQVLEHCLLVIVLSWIRR